MSNLPATPDRPTTEPSAALKGVSRRAFRRALVTAGFLAVGILTLSGLESALKATFEKPPAPLAKELDKMSRNLGSPVRYVADAAVKPDEILPSDIVETLGTSKYLVRQYRDMDKPAGAPGSLVNLNVNY